MTRLAVACYVLAVLALALSLQGGWAPAVVAVAALGAAVTLLALQHRAEQAFAETFEALAVARKETAEAREDVKRLRTEVHATLERLNKRPQGF